MHASARPELSVNLKPTGIANTSREPIAPESMRMNISKVNFFYGEKQTLFDVSLSMPERSKAQS